MNARIKEIGIRNVLIDMDLTFKFPFTSVVSGPTRSGKTEWTKKLIRYSQELITPPPDKIIWCYGEWQDSYNDLAQIPNLEMVEGIPDTATLKRDKTVRKLVVCDDLMQDLSTSKNNELVSLFCRGSHHWNIAIVHIVQNLFYSNLRTARINSHYIVLLKNPSDRLQVINLGKQLYPGQQKFFVDAFNDACAQPFGYLMIDNEPTTNDQVRLRTNIFPGEQCYAYVPK